MRHIPNAVPLIAPCFAIASIAYCEHVGVNLQQPLSIGEMYF